MYRLIQEDTVFGHDEKVVVARSEDRQQLFELAEAMRAEDRASLRYGYLFWVEEDNDG